MARVIAAARSRSPAALAWRKAPMMSPRASRASAGPLVGVPPALLTERPQASAQEGAEEVVVAVPAPADVEAHHEQVRRHELLEEKRRCVVTGHRLAQRDVELVEHRGRVEELHQVRREAVQHLADQEVGDGPVGRRERLQETRSIGRPAQGERTELHARRPALRQLVQLRHLPRLERDVVARQRGGGLLRREAQLGAAQLHELARHTEPAEGEQRVDAAPEDEAHGGWQRPDQAAEHRRGGTRQVEVVDDDRRRLADARTARSLANEIARSWLSVPDRSSRIAASSPTPGQRCPTEARRPRQNRVGSPSEASQESQATESRRASAQLASSAVLPKPAGADKSPTRYPGRSRCSTRWGRATTERTGMGTVSFVTATVPAAVVTAAVVVAAVVVSIVSPGPPPRAADVTRPAPDAAVWIVRGRPRPQSPPGRERFSPPSGWGGTGPEQGLLVAPAAPTTSTARPAGLPADVPARRRPVMATTSDRTSDRTPDRTPDRHARDAADPGPPGPRPDHLRRQGPGHGVPADRAAAAAGRCAERARRPARRRGLRRVERVRGAVPHADRGAPRRGRAALQPLPHHRAVRADPPGAADRPQPPLGRDGQHHRDRHLGARATARCGRTPRRRWR